MSDLGIEHFDQFFHELHGKKPFPWQRNLAARVLVSGWPEVIDLPTASGKTACIDIALFALACGVTTVRRIFFVVDRRVVVNEALIRMHQIAERLERADDNLIAQVARHFRSICGGDHATPLSVSELRGGIYRDEIWVRNPLQPTVIASTVDQLGSRLLFRGYGVTNSMLPIHAALIANDSLILLDDAHCSRAFAATLSRVKEYRGEKWAGQPLGTQFDSVEMTTTPTDVPPAELFGLSADDRQSEHLGKRLHVPKKTRLVAARGRADDWEKLAEVLAKQALEASATKKDVGRVAVMVNRIATARLVWQALRGAGKKADLVIGRMRPMDRDDLNQQLQPLKAGKPRAADSVPWFIVATQCLEVGADLDFDVLITECASMDALLQRFGRLDRLGEFGRAMARIVTLTGQVDGKQSDRVYGEALAKTWEWLSNLAGRRGGELNFGIETNDNEPDTVPQLWKALPDTERKMMIINLPSAPVLLPAHLDALVQTSPRPAVEPSVDLFLHGPQRWNADLQVIWRADLDSESPNLWSDIVAICPPVSGEAMPVPIEEFRRWLRGQGGRSEEADIEGVPLGDEAGEDSAPEKAVLIWRGEESTSDLKQLRPGDTVVIPTEYGGGQVLGHTLVDDGGALDCGDRAFFEGRKRVRLRLHPELLKLWPQRPNLTDLQAAIDQEDCLWNNLRNAIRDYRDQSRAALPQLPNWLDIAASEIVSRPAKAFLETAYPTSVRALAIEGRVQVEVTGRIDGDAEADEMSAGLPITLERHLDDVRREVRTLRRLVPEPLTQAMEVAAQWHDCGKADTRFQVLLHAGDHLVARLATLPLAKGKFVTGAIRKTAERSGLPDGFRHELVSMAMVSAAVISDERDLVLHLIASHHGRCRPLAPVVQDKDAVSLEFNGLSVNAKDRMLLAAHHLNNGVADRFWELTRRFGWWGLAYLETLLRLSDWNASAREIMETVATP